MKKLVDLDKKQRKINQIWYPNIRFDNLLSRYCNFAILPLSSTYRKKLTMKQPSLANLHLKTLSIPAKLRSQNSLQNSNNLTPGSYHSDKTLHPVIPCNWHILVLHLGILIILIIYIYQIQQWWVIRCFLVW